MTDADRERASLDDGREVVVTPFREVHRPSLARMYDDYPPEHRSLGLPRLLAEEREAWLSGVLEAGRNFVAVVDGTVVGHAVYAPADAEVTDFVIFVDPAFHELGIGSSLLRYAISTAARAGVERIVSHAEADNARALHVYDKVGFELHESAGLVVEVTYDLDRVREAVAE